MIAPPTPTTTPIMVFFDPEDRPELPEPLLPESRLGAPVDFEVFVTATRALVVIT